MFLHCWNICLSLPLIWSTVLPSSFCPQCVPIFLFAKWPNRILLSSLPAENPISTLKTFLNLQIFDISALASLTLCSLQHLFCSYICHSWYKILLLFFPVSFFKHVYFVLLYLAEDHKGNIKSLSTPLHTFVTLLLLSLLLN